MPSPFYFQRINKPTTTTTSSATTHCTTTPTNITSQKLQLQPTTRYTTPISTLWMPENISHHHTHPVGPNQCCSAVIQTTTAPLDAVWSLLRRFDNPQAYKQFLKSSTIIFGDGDVGSLRQVEVVSGLPAGSSTERLEILDDERHVMSFSVVGGDHRLKNYRSVTTVHRTRDQGRTQDFNSGYSNETVVVESYVVDVPQGNTKEETFVFVDTIVRFNLQSLAKLAESRSKTKRISIIP